MSTLKHQVLLVLSCNISVKISGPKTVTSVNTRV